MRVLLSCYYFSPSRGGEAAVGWRYATGLAAMGHEVTVLFGDLSACQPMKTDVDACSAAAGIPQNVNPVYVAPDRLTRWIHDLHALPGMWFLYYMAYRRWQQLALEAAEKIHEEIPFDLCHQVTIIGYREPGLLWRLGIPFFWGPINGAAMMPWGFMSSLGWRGVYRHALRNFLNALQMRLSGRSRKAARHASKIWAVTTEDRLMVENIWGMGAETMIETGATPDPSAEPRQLPPGSPLRLVWCGILEARKSLDLVLHALAKLPQDVMCEIDVIGDGPERANWKHLAGKLGIDHLVHWHGLVSHQDVQQIMRIGHVLVHSSLKEGTPHVVLEAMTNGLPVICHDACGMGVAVDTSSGIKIPMESPAKSIDGFCTAITSLHRQPERLHDLSQGAIARAAALSWANTVARIDAAYNQVTAKR